MISHDLKPITEFALRGRWNPSIYDFLPLKRSEEEMVRLVTSEIRLPDMLVEGGIASGRAGDGNCAHRY